MLGIFKAGPYRPRNNLFSPFIGVAQPQLGGIVNIGRSAPPLDDRQNGNDCGAVGFALDGDDDHARPVFLSLSRPAWCSWCQR
jgi:hypothetical protein